jgi:hypothetical protein
MLMPTPTPIPSRGARELGFAHRARRGEERVSVQLGLVDQDEMALPRGKHLRAASLHDLSLVAHLPPCHICRIDPIQPTRKPIPALCDLQLDRGGDSTGRENAIS